MNSEKLIISNEQKRNCGDCLHCKVSARSTIKCRECYCSQISRLAVIKEFYWLNRSVCYKFEDMSA